MPWRLSLLASAIAVACVICAPAKALGGGSPDAVYSNLGTFQDDSFAAGGATQQLLNTMTRMAADDLNLVGTPPYAINGFRFIVTNLNAVDVSARPLVRFYLPNGPGGGPGTLIESRTYNPIVFHAGVVGTIKTSSQFVLNVSHIWAGIAFDNNGGTTGATAAQLDNLALGKFSPPELGTSADQYFVTTAAAFDPTDTVGTLTNFGGAPPANFGWEILTAQDVNLSITKSAGVPTAVPGGNVVYTITASNAGPDTVFDARVVDTFPASLACTWTCAGSAGNTCATSGVGDINDATVGLAVGGSVTYTATCAVSPDATGTLVNTAAIFAPGTAVESSIIDNGVTTDVALVAPPAIAKAFGAPGIVAPAGTTPLTFTLTNPNAGTALSGVGFTDTLPAGLTVVNGVSAQCGAGTLTTSGNNTITLTGGTIAPSGICTFSVTVTGTTGGLKGNITTAVTSTEGGPGGTAKAFLVVVQAPTVAPPTIAKAFGAASIVVNGTTPLTFTLTNPNAGTALSGVGFTDTLPAGLTVVDGVSAQWGAGTLTTSGNNTITLTGGTIAPSGICTFSVTVTGTTGGLKGNITTAVTSTEGGPGGVAAASLLVIAPPTIAKAFAPLAILVGGTSTLTFTLTNPNAGTALSGVGFSDTLPTDVVVAPTPGLTNTCGGTVTGAVASSSIVSLADGTLPSGSCTITVNVTGTAGGLKGNTTGAVTSTEGGSGVAAVSFLVVVQPPAVAPPTIAKVFGATSIVVNATTTLAVTLANPNPVGVLSGVGFTDTLPAGLVVATPNGLAGTCGGTATAVAGTNSIALVNGNLVADGSCTIKVNVTGATAGAKNNTTSAVTSSEGGPGGTASASLTVVAPPTIAKSFGAASIVVNGTTTLTVTLVNPNLGTVLGGVGFTDPLPAGLVVATPNGLANTCGGTVTAVAGTGSFGLANVVLAAGGSCTITVNVTGTTAGAKNNLTGAVTSTQTGPAGTASASLTVVGPPTIAKAFGTLAIVLPGTTTTTLTFTLTNPNAGTALTGVGFTDALPPGLTVADDVVSPTCGTGTLTTSNPSTITLTGGTIAPSGTCTFSVTVTGATGGLKSNTTGAVTSTEGGPGGTAGAFLVVVAAPTVAPPTIAKAFGAASIVVNGATTLAVTLTNPNPGTALTGVGFTDTLPAGLVVAAPNGLAGSCGGGTVTAVAGTGSVALANGSLAANGSCTITVNVTGLAGGLKVNTTGFVTSSPPGGQGGTASAGLLVIAPPTIAKAFGAATIVVNGTTTLTVTLTNPNTATALTGVGFTDTLPAGLVVADPTGLAGTCPGTVTAVAGTGSIGLVNGGLPASGSCTITVTVTGTTGGPKNNTTGAVTSTEGGPGGTASASVTVVRPPRIAKAFGVANIGLDAITTLTFTLTNPNAGTALTGVGFTDTLPAGLVVATPNGLAGSCGGGTILAVAGTPTLALAGATLAAGNSCAFRIHVLASATGDQLNTTSAVTSANGGTGNAATASITVGEPTPIPTLSTFLLAVLAIVLLLSALRRQAAV